MNEQKIFTPKEERENEERKREMIELVASKEAVLIVGSGSSARLGYVTWDGLLQKLEFLASKCGDDFDQNDEKRKYQPLKYVEDIKLHIYQQEGNLDKYLNLLSDLFKVRDPSCDDFHRTLISLPFREILTTNYDKVLEAALSEKEPTSAFYNSLVIDKESAGEVHEFIMAMSNRSMPRRIAHLHGRYDIPKDIILSSEDYEKAYGQRDAEWTLHRKMLWAVLATRRVVFIGFSMDDPYLNEMLETVSQDLWRWGKSTHYAIMGISSGNSQDSKNKAERLKERYGVDIVFYKILDGKHLSLDHIIADIAQECDVEIQPAIASQDELSDNDRSKGQQQGHVASKLRNVLDGFLKWLGRFWLSGRVVSESRSTLDWLEQANENMEKGISDDEN